MVEGGAPSLNHVHCLAVSVADSWTGEAIAELLKLSPAGGAKAGSILARLRACRDELPAFKDLIKRFRADVQGLLACQEILKTQGLSHDTLAQCQPLIGEMPSARVCQAFEAYLEYQLATAKTLGLDQLGLPISSDAIESLFGVAKRHGVGQTPDAARIALRLPAWCGAPMREEAEQVLGIEQSKNQSAAHGRFRQPMSTHTCYSSRFQRYRSSHCHFDISPCSMRVYRTISLPSSRRLLFKPVFMM